MATMVAGAGLALMPFSAEAAQGTWIEEITQLTQYHQRLAQFEGRAEAYEAYLAQLESARMALGKGDQQGTSSAMNRFMAMLLAREARIPGWSAQELFNFSVKVMPAASYDASHYGPLASAEDFDYSRGTPLWLGDGAYILDEVWESARSR